jgi:hypothetical protein
VVVVLIRIGLTNDAAIAIIVFPFVNVTIAHAALICSSLLRRFYQIPKTKVLKLSASIKDFICSSLLRRFYQTPKTKALKLSASIKDSWNRQERSTRLKNVNIAGEVFPHQTDGCNPFELLWEIWI